MYIRFLLLLAEDAVLRFAGGIFRPEHKTILDFQFGSCDPSDRLRPNRKCRILLPAWQKKTQRITEFSIFGL